MATQGAFAYLIKPDNAVTIRQVTIGTSEGDMAEIKEGLSPGEAVVLDVPTGLREGSHIR
jgi:multidrug efflux system membrane fusion protein